MRANLDARCDVASGASLPPAERLGRRECVTRPSPRRPRRRGRPLAESSLDLETARPRAGVRTSARPTPSSTGRSPPTAKETGVNFATWSTALRRAGARAPELPRHVHRPLGGEPAGTGRTSASSATTRPRRSTSTGRLDRALGRDLVALLDALELERVSFCGLSLGGATAMWLAANAPERVERLVLACTSPRFGDAGAVARPGGARARARDSSRSPTRFSRAGSPPRSQPSMPEPVPASARC